jgi:hypothetical protein
VRSRSRRPYVLRLWFKLNPEGLTYVVNRLVREGLPSEMKVAVIPLRYRRVFIDKGYRRHSCYHMVASLLDSKSPARGRPKRNPEEWSSRGLPRTIESARFTTSQTYLNPSRVRTALVFKGTRSRTIAAEDEQ